MRTLTIVTLIALAGSYGLARESRTLVAGANTPQMFQAPVVGALAQGGTSNRCVTPAVTCFLQTSVSIGSPCWCSTPNGPSSGTVK